jgi:hypothetical protein
LLRATTCPAQAFASAQAKVDRLIGVPWSVQLTMSVDERTRQSRMVKYVEPSSSWPV